MLRFIFSFLLIVIIILILLILLFKYNYFNFLKIDGLKIDQTGNQEGQKPAESNTSTINVFHGPSGPPQIKGPTGPPPSR